MPILLAAVLIAAPTGPASEARRGLEAQVAAWNRGDLEDALSCYCGRPDIVWVNRMGVTRGFAEFAAPMRRDFADPQRMGRYDVEILEARATGRRAGLIVLRWSITRDGARLMGGVSTQLWEPCGGRYRVVFEHAS